VVPFNTRPEIFAPAASSVEPPAKERRQTAATARNFDLVKFTFIFVGVWLALLAYLLLSL